MISDGVLEAVEKTDLTLNAKVNTMNWACNKKNDGVLCGKVFARGYQQVKEEQGAFMQSKNRNNKSNHDKEDKNKMDKEEIECFCYGEMRNIAPAGSIDEGITDMTLNSKDNNYDDGADHSLQLKTIGLEKEEAQQEISLLQSRKSLNLNYLYIDT